MKDAAPEIFDRYTKYLLGEHVMGLVSDNDGDQVYGEDWVALLKYEKEIRRKAMKLIQGGKIL